MRLVGASAAHDMAGFLSVFQSNLDLLDGEWLSPRAAGAVRSLRALTSYLRGLARELRMAAAETNGRATIRQLRLAAWWPHMGVLLQAVHGESVILLADIPQDLPGVCIRPRHLAQVVFKLVRNASDAVATRAPETTQATGDCRPCEVNISARVAEHGRAVNLTVANNSAIACPISSSRAFDPLLSTRADRSGAGLGLATIQRLVGEVGGRVHLGANVGSGTSVTIELPTHAIDQAYTVRLPAS